MGAKLDVMAGTVSFQLGTVPCVMKVTWGAIAAIEEALGCGMVALTRRIVTAGYGLRDVSTLILHGLKASGVEGNPTIERVSEMVLRAGLLNEEMIQAVTLFCEFALTGGEAPKKTEGSGMEEAAPTLSP